MRNLTLSWIQSGNFVQNLGSFFRFSRKASGGLPTSPASCMPSSIFSTFQNWLKTVIKLSKFATTPFEIVRIPFTTSITLKVWKMAGSESCFALSVLFSCQSQCSLLLQSPLANLFPAIWLSLSSPNKIHQNFPHSLNFKHLCQSGRWQYNVE